MTAVVFRFMFVTIVPMCACRISVRRPDTDVTSSSEYNFRSFAGTVWKTKVEVALADLKQYTGKHDLNLLIPMRSEERRVGKKPTPDLQQKISRHPIGNRMRIE